MRHLKKNNHLSRKRGHRNAMLSNMACSLIEHKRIRTTVAKAKALRSFVEPIITRGKDDSTHSRRMAFRALQNKEAVTELFREIAPKVADRPGGYTRILKTGSRYGDAAEMCLIELVDYNENMLKDSSTKKKSRRSRRSKKSGVAADAGTVADKAADVVEDAKDAAADAVETVKDKVEEVKDTAADKVEDAKEAASDAAEKVADKAKDVAADVKDAAKGAVDKAKDVASDVKDAVADKVEDVKEAAKDVTDDVKDATKDAVDKAKDALDSDEKKDDDK